jgi:hypothetical protein
MFLISSCICLQASPCTIRHKSASCLATVEAPYASTLPDYLSYGLSCLRALSAWPHCTKGERRRWKRPLLVSARCSTIGCVEGRPFTATDIVSILFAVVGCHVNHVVHRQRHQLHCKRGQLLPRMLCGSTECLYAHREAPNASTQSSRQQSSLLLEYSCCTARWRYRRQYRQCSTSKYVHCGGCSGMHAATTR